MAIIGVLFISFCAYSRAEDAQTNQKQQRKVQDSQAAVLHQLETGQASSNPNEQDVHAEVKILNPPEKDFYDKAAFWLNLTLVVVGSIGVGVAIWTVRMIKRQVDTFVSKERARITVDIEPLKPDGRDDNYGVLYPKSPMPPPSGDAWYAHLLISNSGETNAFIGTSLCKAYIKAPGWDPRGEFITSQMGLPKVLHPHDEHVRHSVRIERVPALRLGVDSETAQAIGNGSMGIYVIGHIEYGDVFDNRWTVTFCRKWGAWWFGGQWQEPSLWYDYPDGKSQLNGVFRIKRPSMLRRILRRMGKEKPEAPVVEIT